MYHAYDSERFVLCTEQVVLECRCGERLLLLGREEDWYSEGHTRFECGGCQRSVTLFDRLDEEQLPPLIGDPNEKDEQSIRDLILSLGTTFGRG
jgi:hypothetical protein